MDPRQAQKKLKDLEKWVENFSKKGPNANDIFFWLVAVITGRSFRLCYENLNLSHIPNPTCEFLLFEIHKGRAGLFCRISKVRDSFSFHTCRSTKSSYVGRSEK